MGSCLVYNDMNSSCLQNVSGDGVAIAVLDAMERGRGKSFNKL